MDRPPPPLNYIRSFECAARHLSFTKAAEELGYTQAAISTHIRALEKYVGRDLFVRGTRSVALTEIGEAFLPTLRQGLHQIDTATDAIAMTSRDRSVIIACPTSLAENWLPGCLSGFRSNNRDLEIVVNATIWDSPDDSIADISISVNRNDDIPPGADLMWEETLSLVCCPLATKDMADPMKVASQSKIVVAGRQEYWDLFGQALNCPLMELDNAIRTNATNVALELSANGMGATIALTSVCGAYLERGLLVEPLQIRPKSPWSYYIRMSPDRRSQAARKLREHIIEYAAASRMQP